MKVTAPPNGNVAPLGPSVLLVDAKNAKGPIPSVAKQLLLTP